MNLILVKSLVGKQTLDRSDRRAEHIRKVLLKGGDNRLFVGIPNGPKGMATARVDEGGEVTLNIEWLLEKSTGVVHYPLTLLVGMCRPQTCRKILRDAACLGLRSLVFFGSEKGEKGYASSSLWTTDEWERQLYKGVEQAFDTFVPEIVLHSNLDEAIAFCVGKNENDLSIALDNYEATIPLSESSKSDTGIVLAIGSERGWSDGERNLLRKKNFIMAHLGSRVMRTETAVIAGCSVISSIQGWYGV